jgi:membrane protein YqaA with SNARE-associated domain
VSELGEVLTMFALGFASALVPLINIEAYLGLRAALSDPGSAWFLGLVAATGQMLGKLIWYYLGANSLSWGWVRRRVEQPKRQAQLATCRRRTAERPVIAGATVFSSSVLGLPPLAILAVVAGQLRMNLALFLCLVLVGRWLRFAAVLGGVAWLQQA